MKKRYPLWLLFSSFVIAIILVTIIGFSLSNKLQLAPPPAQKKDIGSPDRVSPCPLGQVYVDGRCIPPTIGLCGNGVPDPGENCYTCPEDMGCSPGYGCKFDQEIDDFRCVCTKEESIEFNKESDNLNLGETLFQIYQTLDDENFPRALRDSTYRTSNNNEFNIEQRLDIAQGLELQHFRDNDYENLVGLEERTPVIGIKILTNEEVFAYVLDFIPDASSEVIGNNLVDFKGTTLEIMGTHYLILEAQAAPPMFELMQSSKRGTIREGEVITYTVDGRAYQVVIEIITSNQVKLNINGESTGSLAEGGHYTLSDGTIVGINMIEVVGEVGSAEFVLGNKVIELVDDLKIKVNDDVINGVTSDIILTTAGQTATLDAIKLYWVTDDESFIAPIAKTTMPGLDAFEFNYRGFDVPYKERLLVDPDAPQSIALRSGIKDGRVDINLLYTDGSGVFTGIGESDTQRLATSATTSLTFYEKDANGNDYHAYFVASYNNPSTNKAESYLLRARVSYNSNLDRNEVDIENYANGWEEVCTDIVVGAGCEIGMVGLYINLEGDIVYIPGGEQSVKFTVNDNVNFHELYTKQGLKINLPLAAPEGGGNGGGGCNPELRCIDLGVDSTYDLYFTEEDIDENIAQGEQVYITLGMTSDNKVQVSQINGAGTGGPNGLEVGDNTGVYETYIVSPLATYIRHYTNEEDPAYQDYAEITYHGAESYGKVYLSALDVCGSSNVPNCVVPPNDMVSWWDFEDGSDGTDIWDGNDGVPHGAVGTTSLGKVGNAGIFDGNSYIQVPDADNLDVTSLTIDAWVKPESFYDEDVILVKEGSYAFGIQTLAPGNFLACSVLTAAGTFGIDSSTELDSSVWSHIACTYDEATGILKVYIDGEEAGSFDGPDNNQIIPSLYDLFIGCPPTLNSDDCYNGLIDEEEIFNRALEPWEIQDVYNAKHRGKCKNTIPIPFTCGDGWPDPGEQCDDGNTFDTFHLENPNDNDGECVIDDVHMELSCAFNTCGDGYLNLVEEQCDDANNINGDGCDSSCQLENCGDGNCQIGLEDCANCALDCEGCCFLPNTQILTPFGTKNIQDIKINDLVISYNEITQTQEPAKVTKTFTHDVVGYIIINNKLKLTQGHVVYLNGIWQEIDKAKIGDKIKTKDAEETIFSIEEINQPATTYNLEVEGNNNYFAEGLLVHNKPPESECDRLCGDGYCDVSDVSECNECANCNGENLDCQPDDCIE